MILPSWSPTHPSQDALKRMMAARLYPGPHDIFATLLRAPTRASIGARADQLKADHGHIVVRVAPGGDSYRVFVLDEASPVRQRSLSAARVDIARAGPSLGTRVREPLRTRIMARDAAPVVVRSTPFRGTKSASIRRGGVMSRAVTVLQQPGDLRAASCHLPRHQSSRINADGAMTAYAQARKECAAAEVTAASRRRGGTLDVTAASSSEHSHRRVEGAAQGLREASIACWWLRCIAVQMPSASGTSRTPGCEASRR